MPDKAERIVNIARITIWSALIAQALWICFSSVTAHESAHSDSTSLNLWPPDLVPHPHFPQPDPGTNDAQK